MSETDGVTVMVALLRGVNVGGRAKLAMADLRAVAERCGYEDARTYIQSGNLVLRTKERRPATVARTLHGALADDVGLATPVVVRTRAQLQTVVDRNPYLQQGEDPAHLHVVFLERQGTIDLDLDRYAPEHATVIGQEVYLLLPGGVGRSRLATDLGRAKGPDGTMRNWRTVTKLLEMADDLEQG